MAGECYVPVAAIKEAAAGRETEILDKLGIRWRDGKLHIRCPYLAQIDKNPSWRWDALGKLIARSDSCVVRGAIADPSRVRHVRQLAGARHVAERLAHPEALR